MYQVIVKTNQVERMIQWLPHKDFTCFIPEWTKVLICYKAIFEVDEW